MSAGNMLLKLGDAAGAMDIYLRILQEGGLHGNPELLLRKMREASATLPRG